MLRSLFMAAIIAASFGQSSEAFAYACNNRHYVNSSGHWVHSSTCGGGAPGRQTAICRDGSESHSEHHRGTCSRHGGVARWE